MTSSASGAVPPRTGKPVGRDLRQFKKTLPVVAALAIGNDAARHLTALLNEQTSEAAREENDMTATYTWDVFSSLDGYGAAGGDWTGYWGKQGPELLDHRLELFSEEQRMVFGANTYRAFVGMLASGAEEFEVRDPWVTRMVNLPATVVSKTLEGPLTGRTGPSRAGTPSTSSRGSRRSPTCRCARTAACR